MANERFTSMADELTFGTLPTTGYVRLPLVSNTLALNRDTVRSNVITGKRGITNVRPGNDNVTGALNFELGTSGLEKVFRHLLGVGFSDGSSPSTSTTLSAAASAGDTTVTVASATGLAVNDFIRIDTTASEKSEVKKITAVNTNTLTLDAPLVYSHSSGANVVEVTAPFTHTYKRGPLPVGFTIQKHFEDIAQFYKYSGCRFNNGAITVPQTGLATLNCDVRGKTSVLASSASGGTLAEPTFTPYISWEGALLESGVSVTTVTSFSITIDNALLDSVYAVGARERIKLPEQAGGATGNVGLYVEDTTILNKFRSETESSIKVTFTATPYSLEIFLPRIKYTGGAGDPSMEAAFGPVAIDNFPIQALIDTSTGTDVRITYVSPNHLI